MKTQTEIDRERDEMARQAPPEEVTASDLTASDFFPPGEGWNQGEGEPNELASPQHRLPDQDPKRH